VLGVVIGGRLGYVLFYKPGYYLQHPLEAFAVWQGGMSFHGGLIGDVICCVEPIGQFFGRIANFINGELYGRPAPADLPWAMVFPTGGPEPRHPSQLYQAGLEGLALGLVLFVLWRFTGLRHRPGALSGVFLAGYGIARMIGETFRQPDAHLGYLWGGFTMGQFLSLPLVLVGAGLVWAAVRGKTA
jgi:phosphatidylglycerol:prolipoprotein diacylglycerol transferase